MDDSYNELQNIFKNKIEEVKNSDYEKLITICKQENIDYEELTEEEIRKELINYYSEELED